MLNGQRLWIIICNPENRRFEYFNQALAANPKTQGDQLLTLSYLELLTATDLEQYLTQKLTIYQSDSWHVKIESMGENFDVETALLDCLLPKSEMNQFHYDKGRYRYTDILYLSFKNLLTKLSTLFVSQAQVKGVSLHYLNSPDSILLMCDKLLCQQHLQSHGIKIPPLLPKLDSFDQLLDYMQVHKTYQVFVKSRYGSSASGLLALRVQPGTNKMIGRSTLEIASHHCFYNSLKVRTYTKKDELACLFNLIQSQQGYCEVWLPKPSIASFSFDIRMLILNSNTDYFVTRSSRSPMTNLHLGNQRADIKQHKYGAELLENTKTLARKVALTMPEALCIGADILPNKKGGYAIELNAFGDLLPNILVNHKDTYQAQIEVMTCA